MSKEKKLFLKLIVLCYLIAALLLCWVLIKQNKEIGFMILKQKELHQQIKKEKEIEEDLKVKISQLQNEEYIEKLARSEYFLSKEGEIIFILPEKKK